MKYDINPNTPLRKARLALGLTTEEAGQYVRVTRKTWEAWEAKEAAGEQVPIRALELFHSKLEGLAASWRGERAAGERGELVVVVHFDPLLGGDRLADVVSSENYLGNDPAEPGFYIIKSLAVRRSGEPYVHRTRYEGARNAGVLKFCKQHKSVAE